MTATKKPVDPLAGIPLSTAKPKYTPKSKTPTVSVPGVINFATAKANHKRRKLTGQEYKDARDTARAATGYGETSPIWGHKLIDVLVDIETLLNAGDYSAALMLNQELQKRIATQSLIAAQRDS